jgi:hypothetical protein
MQKSGAKYKGRGINLADLQALIDQYNNIANNNYQSQYASTGQDYDSQIKAIQDQYNTTLGQDKQTLAAIPGQYQPIRNSAYLANQKANLALPAQMANSGYASNSGLAYDTRQNNNATWQKSVDTADQAQNTSTQNENNAIANLSNTYNSNLGTVSAKKAEALAAIDTAKQSWVNEQAQTAYNNELTNEAAIAKAQAEATAASSNSSSSSSKSNSSDIGIGSSGDNVSSIQSNLTALGYDTGGIDGVYGNNTAAAMKAFQAAYGLTQTGIYDDKTAQMMSNIAIHLSNVADQQRVESQRESVGRGQTQ